MKKTLLLFILPATFVMSIDFTMTKDGLFPSTNDIITENNENQTISSVNQPSNSDVSNLQINTITNNSATITWSGNPNAQTWVHVYEPYNVTGNKHSAKNNHFTYPTLAANTSFSVYIQGTGSEVVLHKNFKTQNNTKPQDTTTAETPVQNEISQPIVNSESPNSYLEEVNLPKCDVNNPEVQLIKTNADWSHINDTNKRIFCVSPGDYSALKNIKLTTSGTSEKRRYIMLNNGNNLHPGKLNKDQLAQYALKFYQSNFWTIDRGYWTGSAVGIIYHFTNTSSHNIINRGYITKNICTVEIRESCNNNTIQNTRIDYMTEKARKNDQVSIRLLSSKTNFDIKNTKIINNEIKNSNDSFQTVLSSVTGSTKQNGNCEGTIIAHNNFYITSEIYTDGKGRKDSSGAYAYAENAIDLKFGSKNPNNPIIIINNTLGGYRKSDKTNSYTGDPGYAVVAHYNVGNMIFAQNIIFDSNAGFGASDKKDYPYALYATQIKDNIFYNCGQIPGSGQVTYPILIGSSNNISLTHNTIIDSRNNAMFLGYNASDMSVTENYVINSNSEILLVNNILGKYDSPITRMRSDFIPPNIIIDKFTNHTKSLNLE